MVVPLSKTSLFSSLHSHSQRDPFVDPFPNPRRGYHIELGPREKALLEEDPALKKFILYKNKIKQVSKLGDALTLVVAAGCVYQILSVMTRIE